jgi:hypothetical protein
MSEQLALPSATWPCDLCEHGLELDRVTGLERTCRLCCGVGRLDHDPALVAVYGPFYGLGSQAA